MASVYLLKELNLNLMDNTFINILLGIVLGLSVYAFFYAIYLITPLIQEAISNRKVCNKKFFSGSFFRNK